MTKSLIIKFLAGIDAVILNPGGRGGAVPEELSVAIIRSQPETIGNLCLYAFSDERSVVSGAYVWVYKDLITNVLYELAMYINDTKIIARRVSYTDKFLFEQLRYTSQISAYNAANRNRKINLYLTEDNQSKMFDII